MKKVNVPEGLKLGGALKVSMFIGTAGYKRSELYKEGEWEPAMSLYVDNDTYKVVYTTTKGASECVLFEEG